MGFTEFTGEPNLYRKVFELNGKTEEVLIGQYVDDLIIAASSEEARKWFMQKLESRFPVNPKSTGLISFESPGLVLSMHVRYDREQGVLQFDQRAAIEALAARFSVIDLKPKSLPITTTTELPKLSKAEVDPIEYLSVIGSCLHLAQVSRPDVAYAVGVLSRHSATPGHVHMDAAINLVNYLYNSRNLFIQYTRTDRGNEPAVYQKDWSVRKSIEERLKASKPTPLAHSPDIYIDADYAGDYNTAIHIRLLCEESEIRERNVPLTIWEDNTACIHLGHGLRGSKAAKHFEVRLRFLNEQIHNNVIEFSKIDTKDQLADGFTEALSGPDFFKFRDQLLHS